MENTAISGKVDFFVGEDLPPLFRLLPSLLFIPYQLSTGPFSFFLPLLVFFTNEPRARLFFDFSISLYPRLIINILSSKIGVSYPPQRGIIPFQKGIIKLQFAHLKTASELYGLPNNCPNKPAFLGRYC